jgi:hypothetical protein
LYFERSEEAIEPKTVHQLRFRAMFWEDLSIVFGTGMPTTDAEISARLNSVTASWLGDRFGEGWPVRLTAEPKTSDLGNEIYAMVKCATDDPWEGIRRIPGLPSVAAPLAKTVSATKMEEAVGLIQYGWRAGWPVKGTIAITIDYGTPRAWEFSATLNLGKTEEEPTWQSLWALMGGAVAAEGIRLSDYVSKEFKDYSIVCEKYNQTISVLWRQLLPGNVMPSIPQDHGLPVRTVYGKNATLKMRGFQQLGMKVEDIVHELYGPHMRVQVTQSRNWSYNAMMIREGESAEVIEEVAVQILEKQPVVPGFNEALRESSEIVANVDKGFQD